MRDILPDDGMKRIAVVFLISILIPALLLAALAIRSVRDQEVVINNQKVLVHQSTCDTIVADINLYLDDVRVFYGNTIEELAAERGESLVSDFHEVITESWTQAAVGAVVSESGDVLSPGPDSGSQAQEFLENHALFLGNEREVEVYQAPQVLNNQLQVIEKKDGLKPSSKTVLSSSFERDQPSMDAAEEQESPRELERRKNTASEMEDRVASPQAAASTDAKRKQAGSIATKKTESSKWSVTLAPNKLRDYNFSQQNEPAAPETAVVGRAPALGKESPAEVGAVQLEVREELRKSAVPPQARNVAPVQSYVPDQTVADSFGAAPFDNRSRLNPEAVNLSDLSRGEREGAVSRLIDGSLHVLLWKRSPLLPGYTFWTELNLEEIQSELSGLFEADALPGSEEVSFALLDSDGDPVALTEEGFSADWSLPFVASEVGQILPRWEVAAYLLNPSAMSESARTVRLTLWLIVLVLLGAVGVGCLLILKSVNYEMRLATQKTDFVSNVSHELKTPLTSIRMFSELLAGSREQNPDQTRKYSEVISKESARLTRLINRLLDFSRLDRGEMKLRTERIDLGQLAEETVEMYRAGVETEGWDVTVESQSGVEMEGDRDALSQVILNLLSNAEKYAAEGGGALVEVKADAESICLAVHDRGPGIPRAHQRNIFDKFYRVDDSIDSGIEGSGIGLALCQQIVERLGGTIQYEKRGGGGSSFVVRFPVTDSK
ncbi:MAG: HAMP domain-containing sensor histidine kinase [Verrucomicrobiales bacterium]|nr:HAMP domain-containing sensor histidine kinase [Verrucomicrobiales bacterium]